MNRPQDVLESTFGGAGGAGDNHKNIVAKNLTQIFEERS